MPGTGTGVLPGRRTSPDPADLAVANEVPLVSSRSTVKDFDKVQDDGDWLYVQYEAPNWPPPTP